MKNLSRRDFIQLSIAASASVALAIDPSSSDIHPELLELASRFERQRRACFAAVASKADLESLQASLRQTFLRLLGGLPESPDPPKVIKTATIDAGDYVVEKLVYESLSGYFVPALLYRPKKNDVPAPGVLSPCGHSETGKAADAYQILHINLARRGYVVLTYDPVGQGERSQFWDDQQQRSRFNLACGEHAVLGNPLYLLGGSLARYRIWDGMRGLDYLASLPEVDPTKIGCVGNSGGGTLTAYIAALDPRVAAAAICCYITTLPRRMANRIQTDPDADPEQDIFGFVSQGIDHAGLLAMISPRPVLIGAAQDDFFPIEGTRETFAEAKRLYTVVNAPNRIDLGEAPGRHGLSLVLRMAVYRWFDRWLLNLANSEAQELSVSPRPAKELLVCPGGQVNQSFHSRPLLELAWEEFAKSKRPPKSSLRDLLKLDFDRASPRISVIAEGGADKRKWALCINGNEAPDWREEKSLLSALGQSGWTAAVVELRGAGQQRPRLEIARHEYSDPLVGVEENIAYNALLVGKSLLAMRVADVLEAVRETVSREHPDRLILMGRKDSALAACFATAIAPVVERVAVEEMRTSFRSLFDNIDLPINAASLLPGLLKNFGDLEDVLGEISPRKILLAASIGPSLAGKRYVEAVAGHFTSNPKTLLNWLES